MAELTAPAGAYTTDGPGPFDPEDIARLRAHIGPGEKATGNQRVLLQALDKIEALRAQLEYERTPADKQLEHARAQAQHQRMISDGLRNALIRQHGIVREAAHQSAGNLAAAGIRLPGGR
jgi:hypothetical protein